MKLPERKLITSPKWDLYINDSGHWQDDRYFMLHHPGTNRKLPLTLANIQELRNLFDKAEKALVLL